MELSNVELKMGRECSECGADSSYRCPTCNIRYCSVSCCKKHKTNKCSPPEPPEEESKPSYNHPTEDTVPLEKLKCLEQSDDLKDLIKNKELRDIMKSIHSQMHPETMLKYYMNNPIFSKFTDLILGIVEPQEKENEDDVLTA